MYCTFHSTNRAVVQCNQCGRALCAACDHRIRGFPFCQDCIIAGVELLRQQQSRLGGIQVVRRKTSPFTATLLSFFVPGLGAAYNGQTSKAIVHFAIFASFFQMAVITDGATFFVLGVVGTWLFSAVDACRTAQLLRAGLAPEAEEDAIAHQLYGNPFAWGITLIVMGSIFLAHTLLGVQFPVRKILPIALVILGAYILFDYLKRHRRRAELRAFDATSPPPSVVAGGLLGSPRFGTGEFPTRVNARLLGSSRFRARP